MCHLFFLYVLEETKDFSLNKFLWYFEDQRCYISKLIISKVALTTCVKEMSIQLYCLYTPSGYVDM